VDGEKLMGRQQNKNGNLSRQGQVQRQDGGVKPACPPAAGTRQAGRRYRWDQMFNSYERGQGKREKFDGALAKLLKAKPKPRKEIGTTDMRTSKPILPK